MVQALFTRNGSEDRAPFVLLTRASHGAQTSQLFSRLVFLSRPLFRPRRIKTELTFGLRSVVSAFSKQIMCVKNLIISKINNWEQLFRLRIEP